MIAPRLREQPAEVQDVFAVARAALDGFEATGRLTQEMAQQLLAGMLLWEELWGEDV